MSKSFRPSVPPCCHDLDTSETPSGITGLKRRLNLTATPVLSYKHTASYTVRHGFDKLEIKLKWKLQTELQPTSIYESKSLRNSNTACMCVHLLAANIRVANLRACPSVHGCGKSWRAHRTTPQGCPFISIAHFFVFLRRFTSTAGPTPSVCLGLEPVLHWWVRHFIPHINWLVN